jgi:hypothetical protein
MQKNFKSGLIGLFGFLSIAAAFVGGGAVEPF